MSSPRRSHIWRGTGPTAPRSPTMRRTRRPPRGRSSASGWWKSTRWHTRVLLVCPTRSCGSSSTACTGYFHAGTHGRRAASPSTTATRRQYRIFADAVADEVQARGGRALVMIQDYHFYLVAERVRRRCPDALLSHFIHIPWPGPDAWRILPPACGSDCCAACSAATSSRSTPLRYARNFVSCCEELLGLEVDRDDLTIPSTDRRCWLGTTRSRSTRRPWTTCWPPRRSSPPAALTEAFSPCRVLRRRGTRASPQVVLSRRPHRPEQERGPGFPRLRHLLDQHPELVGQVSFLALLQPSRTDVPSTATTSRIGAVVAEVNARHTADGRQPIDLRLVEDFPLAVGRTRSAT